MLRVNYYFLSGEPLKEKVVKKTPVKPPTPKKNARGAQQPTPTKKRSVKIPPPRRRGTQKPFDFKKQNDIEQ